VVRGDILLGVFPSRAGGEERNIGYYYDDNKQKQKKKEGSLSVFVSVSLSLPFLPPFLEADDGDCFYYFQQ